MNKYAKAAIARRVFRERGPMTILEAQRYSGLSSDRLRSVVCEPEYRIVKPRGVRREGGAVWALAEVGSTLTALADGGTVHRRDGSDPWPGVCVAAAG